MSFKWTPSQLQTDNVTDVDAFNERYGQLKSELNGSMGRDQLPERSITTAMLKSGSFYRFKREKLRLQDPYRAEPTPGLSFPGCQYSKYSGGLVRSNSYTFDCVEGMLHIEASLCFYLQHSTMADPEIYWTTIKDMQPYGQFQLLVNSVQVVSPEFKVWQRGGTVYMVGDIPVSDGDQTIQFFWGARPPGEVDYLKTGASGKWTSRTDEPVFFFDGGTLLLINRFR
tara:strand:+ start:9070 stop:9747 length:678 start_codon:yes stop_codon:yes gene_type:complete